MDFGTEFLHGSEVRLALTGSGIVARALVEQTQEPDGIDRAKVIGKDGDSVAVEVNGIDVIRGGAHGISGFQLDARLSAIADGGESSPM